MTTEAQRLADILENEKMHGIAIDLQAAALLRRQEAALMQAREALEYAIPFDGANQQIRSALATLNELLGEQT